MSDLGGFYTEGLIFGILRYNLENNLFWDLQAQ